MRLALATVMTGVQPAEVYIDASRLCRADGGEQDDGEAVDRDWLTERDVGHEAHAAVSAQ
jgi:hypothetical protein